MRTTSAHSEARTSRIGARNQFVRAWGLGDLGAWLFHRVVPTTIAAVAPKVSQKPTSAIASGETISTDAAVSAIACIGAVR